jgi:Mg-chelatase subunit ChlD
MSKKETGGTAVFLKLFAAMLLVPFLYVSCSGPLGPDQRSDSAGTSMPLRALSVAEPLPDVDKTVDPQSIWLYGSDESPDTTTVTIEVTGYAGTVTEARAIDVIFAIDVSGSMMGTDPSYLRLSATRHFIDQLIAYPSPENHQAGLIGWNQGIRFAQPLDTNLTFVQSLLTSTHFFPNGQTNISGAIAQAISMLDAETRMGSSKVIVLLTDGYQVPTGTFDNNVVIAAANKGYRVYTVGLGNHDVALLQSIANDTGGLYLDAPVAAEIETAFEVIYEEVVKSTAPSFVDVVEITQYYIVDEGSFSIPPDVSTTFDLGGETYTRLEWHNVAQHVGDFDQYLSADETFSVSFTAGSSMAGKDLPVQLTPEAVVNYLNPDGEDRSVPIPQGYLTVIQPVLIDIKPGSDPNSINARMPNVVIPVAILGSEDFDALSVDHTTVVFEGATEQHVNPRTGVAQRHEEDVNGDGYMDLVFHFRLGDTDLFENYTAVEGVLTGETYDGTPIQGSDAVRMLQTPNRP